MVMIMLFFGISFTACETLDLKEYKLDAVKELDNYLDIKKNEELANRETILDIVTKGKTQINKAEDKVTVNNAVNNVKEIIVKLYEEEAVLVKQVKQSYLDSFIKRYRADATLDDVVILEYLGTYNENFVAIFYDKQNSRFIDRLNPRYIAGMDFSFSEGFPILVWKNGIFYSLSKVYRDGEVLTNDLESIYNLYHNKHLQQKIS